MTLLGASGEALAAELEKADALPTHRHLFHLPDGIAYLAGNSLGLQTRAASQAVNEAMQSWAIHGVEGHALGEFPWVNYHATMEHTAASLVGANPGEAVVMNTLTANLHVMLQSFYRPTTERFQIAFEANVFPSDRYAFLNTVQSHGCDSADGTVVITPEGEHLEVADVEAALQRSGHNIAVLMLSAIDFRTGAFLDIAAITEAAHRFGIVVGWDLAHAAGNVPLQLHDWNVDFAVWCHYKYLNSGPGAVAGCFVHERHGNDSTLVRPGGWWGHDPTTRSALRLPTPMASRGAS